MPEISGPADTRGTWAFEIPRTGQLISPVLRLHGRRALGVSDRPAPREPMTKPFLSRDFRLSDRTPPILMWQSLQRHVRETKVAPGSHIRRWEVHMMTRYGSTPTSCLLRETTTPHSPCYTRRTRSRAPRLLAWPRPPLPSHAPPLMPTS